MKTTQMISSLVVACGLLSTGCLAQLSGRVGPTTSTASKTAKKVCNVMNYGAKADMSTDLGGPLAKAWGECKNGGVVYVPPGNYAMSNWQTLSGGSGWALQLDGIIYRTGTAGGHMIIVENTSDFEFFSSTSKGAMQGYGYVFHAKNTYGPRLVRLVKVTNFSFHDVMLVDSPAFHLIVDNCNNGEIYNLIIRGANRGGLDGIDTSGANLWYHDIEVTNKDECVTIKSPSKNTLVENVYCNWSGGCSFGSLGSGTAISDIKYNNIYSWASNQMLMIKTNGGNGYVKDCSFSNFIGHSNAYALDINEHWGQRKLDPGPGVSISNIKFTNWAGTISSASRPVVNLICSDTAPCTGITLTNVNLWTDANTPATYACESAYGTGACMRSGTGGSYTASSKINSAPDGYKAAKMPDDLPAGLGLTKSIAIPSAIPTSFYPGVPAITPLLNGGKGAPQPTPSPSSTSSSAVISLPIPTPTSLSTSLPVVTPTTPTSISIPLSTSVTSIPLSLPTSVNATSMYIPSTMMTLPSATLPSLTFPGTPTDTTLPTTAVPVPTTIPAEHCGRMYDQCGGAGYSGTNCCATGSSCQIGDEFFSQCMPV